MFKRVKIYVDISVNPLVREHSSGKSTSLMGNSTVHSHVQYLFKATKGYYPSVYGHPGDGKSLGRFFLTNNSWIGRTIHV